jgi:hypothetical protein
MVGVSILPIILLVLTAVSAISVQQYPDAKDVSVQISMDGDWNQLVSVNATSRDLGMAGASGVLVITTPANTYVPGTRGSLTSSLCHTNYYVYNATTYCFPEEINNSSDLNFTVTANGIKGTKASGTVTIHGYSNSTLGDLVIRTEQWYTPCLD